MKEALDLIDQIIEEHKQITQEGNNIKQVSSDYEVGLKLGDAKEGFIPGGVAGQKRYLQNLRDSLETINQDLLAHFEREEKWLLAAFEKHGGKMLAIALRGLLLEHQELKKRIAKSLEDLARLATEGVSREVWEGHAWGVRTYLSHTLKLIEAHAQSEQELLQKLRSALIKA
jgi:hypothetical protein